MKNTKILKVTRRKIEKKKKREVVGRRREAAKRGRGGGAWRRGWRRPPVRWRGHLATEFHQLNGLLVHGGEVVVNDSPL